MAEFFKMDVFFFVTTLSVIVLTSLTAYVLWRVARVIQYIEHISKQFSFEIDEAGVYLAEMRSDILRGKDFLKKLLNFMQKRTKKKVNKK
jgi:hypothetical protein